MKFYLFDRTEKIIHFEDLSILSDREEIKDNVQVSMSENEIFVFQIAAVSDCDDVIEKIEAEGNVEVSCINTDAVDKFGKSKTQSIMMTKNIIQPLFFTVKADKIGARQEKCKISISTAEGTYGFDMLFDISTAPVRNKGYDDLWRLSRIAWLNSRLYQDESIVKPYTKPELKNGRMSVIGREIELGKYGLPAQIYSKFSESVELENEVQKTLFEKPSQFLIGDAPIPDGETGKEVYPNRIEAVTESVCDDYSAKISSVLRYEGMIEYSVEITPKRDFTVDNTELRFFISKDCVVLMHGLGHRVLQLQDEKTSCPLPHRANA